MFAQINVYKNLIIAGVVVLLVAALYFYIGSLKSQISQLRAELMDTKIALVQQKRQSELYKSSLDRQSDYIESIKVGREKALIDLQKWKNKPAKVKYKVIYKTRDIKSNDCKDIKTLINGVRAIDFSSL